MIRDEKVMRMRRGFLRSWRIPSHCVTRLTTTYVGDYYNYSSIAITERQDDLLLHYILPAQTGQHVPSVFVWLTQESTGQVLIAQVTKLSCIITHMKTNNFIQWMHDHFTFRLDVSLRLYKCFYFVLHVFVLERPMIGTIGPPGGRSFS